MDAKLISRIQREGAEALLDAGVSLPLKDFKVPFRKSPLRVRLTMRRPTLGRLISISREWLDVGMTLESFECLDYEGQMGFLVKHGKKLSRMIALTLSHRWLGTGLLSWLIRRFMKREYMIGAIETFLSLLGTRSFTLIISLADTVNPMKARLSR